MPIDFRIEKDAACVYAIAREPLSDEDLRQYQLDLAAHPDHGPGFNQLVDLRAVGVVNLTSSGIRLAGHLSDRFADHVRGTQCALVVESSVAYGLARMFLAQASETVDFQVFQDLVAAREWLGLGIEPPPSGAIDGGAAR